MDWEEGKMQYIGYKKIEGTITVITGLHIGGSTVGLEIGGKDNPIIKHPVTKEPYIPGSSLKGKMRSLLELHLGKHNNPSIRGWGEVHTCADSKCPVCVIFGSSADESTNGPTRLVVRDAILDDAYKEEQKRKNSNWTALDLTESKYENSINRITARANPRNFERAVPGAKFSFEMIYRVFKRHDEDDKKNPELEDEKLFENVLTGLKLIENDALGGAGSRGCGQVEFKIEIGNGHPKSLADIKSSDIKTIFIEKQE
jgi:CRISPR-associated protein Csm3